MEYMPCGSFQANAVSFAIGVLTYNLYLGFRSDALGSEHSQVQTVCWRLFHGASVSETPEIPTHGQKIAGGAGWQEASHPLHCPKCAENPFPTKAVASSKISWRILGEVLSLTW
jgi:hypothetical protein